MDLACLLHGAVHQALNSDRRHASYRPRQLCASLQAAGRVQWHDCMEDQRFTHLCECGDKALDGGALEGGHQHLLHGLGGGGCMGARREKGQQQGCGSELA